MSEIHLSMEVKQMKEARKKCLDLGITFSKYIRNLIKKDLK